jgi:hypothetical protein
VEFETTSVHLTVEAVLQQGFNVVLKVGSKSYATAVPADLFVADGPLDPLTIGPKVIEDSTPASELVDMGTLIADSLLATTGPAGKKWREIYKTTQDEYEQWQLLSPEKRALKPAPLLRTYLSVTKELVSLPWEALCIDGQPVFFLPYSALVRLLTKKLLKVQQEEMWPIHLLILVGADQADAGILKVREEIYALERVLRDSSYSFLVKVCYADKAAKNGLNSLKREIENHPPDILHFIGHATDNPPGLMINDDPWSHAAIETWMKTVPPIRLVYLNACRTQVSAQTLRSVSAAFLNGSALSTIAMHADVKGKAAGECAGLFYKFLIAGRPIDAALSMARGRLSANNRGAFLPALTVKTDPALILNHCCSVSKNVGNSMANSPLNIFVDRHDHRRKLLSHFFAAEAKERRYVLGLKGLPKSGKTALSWWCLGTLAWRNLMVIRADAGKYKDWYALLTAIANGDSQDLRGLPAQPMEEFRKLAGEANGIGGVKNIDKFFSVFLEGLRGAAGDRQVILCIDEWKKTEMSGDPLTYLGPLIKYLFNPIANGDGKIRALVPADWDSIPSQQLEPLSGRWDMVHLDKFSAAEFRDLAFELYGAKFPEIDYPADLDSIIERYPATDSMTPEDLIYQFDAYLVVLKRTKR